MQITMKGFDKFEKELLNIARKKAPEKIDEQVDRMATQVLSDTKLGTPTKSRNLSRKWTKSDASNGTAMVSNPEKYAAPIEKGFKHKNGGYKVPGVHMLESAMKRLDNRMASEMNDFFDDLFRELK